MLACLSHTCHTSVTLLTQAARERKRRERSAKKADGGIPSVLPLTQLHTENPPHVAPPPHLQQQFGMFLQFQQFMSHHHQMGHAPLQGLPLTHAPHVPRQPGGLSPSPNTQSQGSTP